MTGWLRSVYTLLKGTQMYSQTKELIKRHRFKHKCSGIKRFQWACYTKLRRDVWMLPVSVLGLALPNRQSTSVCHELAKLNWVNWNCPGVSKEEHSFVCVSMQGWKSIPVGAGTASWQWDQEHQTILHLHTVQSNLMSSSGLSGRGTNKSRFWADIEQHWYTSMLESYL